MRFLMSSFQGFSYFLIFIGEIYLHVSAETPSADNVYERSLVMHSKGKGSLKGHVIDQSTVTSLMECGLKCARLLPDCKSLNYVTEGQSAICEINNSSKRHAHKDDFVQQINSQYLEPIADENQDEINQDSSYIDGPWTLVARFSNNDSKNWMEDNGTWWYDRVEPYGNTLDPSDNTDMISEAFWLQQGSEFKITKSDDPTHTALLTTTGDCLNGVTFRAKLKGYGVFRGNQMWASNLCLGNCSVRYIAGNNTAISDFGEPQCDGVIQARDAVGFWCDYDTGDGAVLMIGGGGKDCHRADHGIGITEANEAAFESNPPEYDFGNDANRSPPQLYSLNMWVRRV